MQLTSRRRRRRRARRARPRLWCTTANGPSSTWALSWAANGSSTVGGCLLLVRQLPSILRPHALVPSLHTPPARLPYAPSLHYPPAHLPWAPSLHYPPARLPWAHPEVGWIDPAPRSACWGVARRARVRVHGRHAQHGDGQWKGAWGAAQGASRKGDAPPEAVTELDVLSHRRVHIAQGVHGPPSSPPLVPRPLLTPRVRSSFRAAHRDTRAPRPNGVCQSRTHTPAFHTMPRHGLTPQSVHAAPVKDRACSPLAPHHTPRGDTWHALLTILPVVTRGMPSSPHSPW